MPRPDPRAAAHQLGHASGEYVRSKGSLPAWDAAVEAEDNAVNAGLSAAARERIATTAMRKAHG